MTKDDIEKQLKRYLGVEKVIWLPRGLFGTFRCSLSGLRLGQHHQDAILYIYSLVIFYTQLLFKVVEAKIICAVFIWVIYQAT